MADPLPPRQRRDPDPPGPFTCFAAGIVVALIFIAPFLSGFYAALWR